MTAFAPDVFLYCMEKMKCRYHRKTPVVEVASSMEELERYVFDLSAIPRCFLCGRARDVTQLRFGRVRP